MGNIHPLNHYFKIFCRTYWNSHLVSIPKNQSLHLAWEGLSHHGNFRFRKNMAFFFVKTNYTQAVWIQIAGVNKKQSSSSNSLLFSPQVLCLVFVAQIVIRKKLLVNCSQLTCFAALPPNHWYGRGENSGGFNLIRLPCPWFFVSILLASNEVFRCNHQKHTKISHK